MYLRSEISIGGRSNIKLYSVTGAPLVRFCEVAILAVIWDGDCLYVIYTI